MQTLQHSSCDRSIIQHASGIKRSPKLFVSFNVKRPGQDDTHSNSKLHLPAAVASPSVVEGTIDVLKSIGTTFAGTLGNSASQKYPVVVVGSEGLIAVRVVQKLASLGFKVTAGVSSLERAQAILDFAKDLEIVDATNLSNVKLVELDLSNADVVKKLPKRSIVLVVDGDVVGKQRTDAKTVQGVLESLEDLQASQVVLISCLGNSSSGGFALFGGGSKSVSQLTRTEQLVTEAPVPHLIVRAYGVLDTVSEQEHIGIAKAGSFSSQQVASKSQVTDVVGEILRQQATSPIFDIVAEVAGTSTPPSTDLTGQILEFLAAQVPVEPPKEVAAPVPTFSIGTKTLKMAETASKQEEKKEPTKESPPPARSFFGAPKAQAPAAPAEEKAEPAKKEPTPPLFFFGSQKVSAQAPKKEEVKEGAKAQEKVEPVKKEAAPFVFPFGSQKITAAAPVVEEKEVAKKEAAPFMFGFGTKKVSAAAPVEEKKEVEKKKEPAPFMFGFGTQKVTAAAPVEEEEEVVVKKESSPFSFFGASKPAKGASAEEAEKKAAPKKAAPVVAKSRSPAPEAEAPKKESKGFFFFGAPEAKAAEASSSTKISSRVPPSRAAPAPKSSAQNKAAEVEVVKSPGLFTFGGLWGSTENETSAKTRSARREAEQSKKQQAVKPQAKTPPAKVQPSKVPAKQPPPPRSKSPPPQQGRGNKPSR